MEKITGNIDDLDSLGRLGCNTAANIAYARWSDSDSSPQIASPIMNGGIQKEHVFYISKERVVDTGNEMSLDYPPYNGPRVSAGPRYQDDMFELNKEATQEAKDLKALSLF